MSDCCVGATGAALDRSIAPRSDADLTRRDKAGTIVFLNGRPSAPRRRGLSLAFGFLTAVGAAGALGAMVMAASTHWAKGFFAARGGLEYPLVLAAVSLALGIAGAGAYSLDALWHVAWPQPLVFAVFAVAALATDVIGIQMTHPAPTAAAPSLSKEQAS